MTRFADVHYCVTKSTTVSCQDSFQYTLPVTVWPETYGIRIQPKSFKSPAVWHILRSSSEKNTFLTTVRPLTFLIVLQHTFQNTNIIYLQRLH